MNIVSQEHFGTRNRLLTAAIALSATFTILGATARAGAIVPNTIGQGADASLGSDAAGVPSTFAGGASNSAEVRANDGATNRNRLGLFRFDISGVAGNLSGAILRFYETGSNSRTVSVYGLNDGDAGEAWSEAAITYDSAPAISLIAGPPPATAFDPLRTTFLGTFDTTASTTETLQFSSAALDSFLAADTNGLVSFYLYRDGGGGVVFRTKEFNYASTTGAVPTLEFPNVVPEPTTGALLVFGVAAIGMSNVRRRSK